MSLENFIHGNRGTEILKNQAATSKLKILLIYSKFPTEHTERSDTTLQNTGAWVTCHLGFVHT